MTAHRIAISQRSRLHHAYGTVLDRTSIQRVLSHGRYVRIPDADP